MDPQPPDLPILFSSSLHPLYLSTTTSARPFTYYSASFVSESITDVLSFHLPVLSETTRTDWTCCSGWVYLSQNRKLLYPSRVSQDHLSGSATSTSRLWARQRRPIVRVADTRNITSNHLHISQVLRTQFTLMKIDLEKPAHLIFCSFKISIVQQQKVSGLCIKRVCGKFDRISGIPETSIRPDIRLVRDSVYSCHLTFRYLY